MDTIYNWLLHNTGNEANYYTILNCLRDAAPDGTRYVRIMGRRKDFNVVDILLYSGNEQEIAGSLPGGETDTARPTKLMFNDQEQVITYLTTGKMSDLAPTSNQNTLCVVITEPTGKAGEITFPSE